MTNDNDMIRRGAILELCQTLEDEAPSGSYDNGGTTDGWMMACRRIEKAVAAIPAVAASPPADPVINVDSRQPEQMYLICKYGGYYRPNCRGYTSSTDEAGRYTLAEAERETHPNGPDGPRDGMTYIPAPPVNADSRQRVTVDSLATLMFNEWKRVDPRSKVAMFPVSYMSTFADMARAVLAAINMQPGPRDAQIAALGPIADILPDAVAAAEKAMRKFPQPNYVITKWAEETGEVTKDLVHMAEGRQTPDKLRGEIVQALAMLHRLLIEGDQVHGLPPLAEGFAALAAVKGGDT